jgi:hypothetical protein
MKMKSIKIALAGFFAVTVILLGLGMTQMAYAADTSPTSDNLSTGATAARPDGVNACLFKGKDCSSGLFTNIVNIALFLIGALSVIMLIYGGIRYTTSGGDAKNVTAAKNTILYAIVGIVVAILAYAIVNFVIARLT